MCSAVSLEREGRIYRWIWEAWEQKLNYFWWVSPIPSVVDWIITEQIHLQLYKSVFINTAGALHPNETGEYHACQSSVCLPFIWPVSGRGSAQQQQHLLCQQVGRVRCVREPGRGKCWRSYPGCHSMWNYRLNCEISRIATMKLSPKNPEL